MWHVEDDIYELLNKLPSECSYIDYKQSPYRKDKKNDFLKDVMGMLNSEECIGKPRYIIIGVTDDKRLLGINPEDQWDDNEYQNLVDKIIPRPHIQTGTIKFQDLTFAYVYIMVENKLQVYEMKEDVVCSPQIEGSHRTGVFKGQAYMRQGSRNSVMLQPDRESLLSNRTPNIQQSVSQNVIAVPKCDITPATAMLGKWNENVSGDRYAMEQIYGLAYDSFLASIRSFSSKNNGAFTFSEGLWSLNNRIETLAISSEDYYDEHIKKLKDISIGILKATDPFLDLEDGQKVAPKVFLKESDYVYSDELRESIFTFWAYAGNHKSDFKNCSKNAIGLAIRKIIEELCNSTSWKIWASMAKSIQMIAESSPSIFLSELQKRIGKEDTAITEYISASEKGIFTKTYGSELCTTLAVMATYKKYFSQSAYIMLYCSQFNKDFFERLVSIMLPWFPLTEATDEARLGFIRSAMNDMPDLAWNLLVQLLPNKVTTSWGVSHPVFLEDAKVSAKGRTGEEYWKEVNNLFIFACTQARKSAKRLCDLISFLDDVDGKMRTELLVCISDDSKTFNDEEKYAIWIELTDFTQKHRKYADAKWALEERELGKVDVVAEQILKMIPNADNRRMFRQNQWELIDETGNYEESEKRIEEKQFSIAENIYLSGFDAVCDFAEIIERADILGRSLAKVDVSSEDKVKFVKGINSANKQISDLAIGYIKMLDANQDKELQKFLNDLSENRQLVQYYSILPISKHSMERIKEVEPELQNQYWKKVDTFRISENTDVELQDVIDAMNHVSRIHEAIEILYFAIEVSNRPVEPSIIYDTLMKCDQEEYNQTDSYELGKLIEIVQKSDLPFENRLELEWKYISFLTNEHEVEPITIYKNLGSNPKAFMDLFSLVYKGRHQEKKDISKQEEHNISAIYSLLYSWKTTPGMQEDGSLDEEKLNSWVNEVLKLAEETDRLEITQHYIGRLLFFSPSADDGFFINRVVASLLQGNTSEDMRTGYLIEAYNSRGVHFVDNTGEAEFKLETEYNEKADEAEKEGYPRFARTLRLIAEDYHNEGLANIEEAKNVN